MKYLVATVLLASPWAAGAFRMHSFMPPAGTRKSPGALSALASLPSGTPEGGDSRLSGTMAVGSSRRGVLGLTAAGVVGVASGVLGGGAGLGLFDPAPAFADVFTESPDPRSYVVVSHRTPSFEKWRKEAVEPNLKDGKFDFPAKMKVIRNYFGKSDNEDGTVTVHAVIVFSTDAMKEVIDFFDEKGPNASFWKGGRDAGWLDGPFHVNFAKSDRYRGVDAGPPATMPKGSGFVFVGHGLGVDYGQWESTFFREYPLPKGCTKAVGGKSYRKGSTDNTALNGVGVFEVFPKYADALAFTKKFLLEYWPEIKRTAADGKMFKDPPYIEVAEITDDMVYKKLGAFSEIGKSGIKA